MSMYSSIGLFDDENSIVWAVVENTTNQVIKAFLFEEEAESLVDKLENGAGFNGYTPAFFLIEPVIPESINDSFSRRFE